MNQYPRHSRLSRSRGFTLVEILIVLGILVIGSCLLAHYYLGARRVSEIQVIDESARRLNVLVEQYRFGGGQIDAADPLKAVRTLQTPVTKETARQANAIGQLLPSTFGLTPYVKDDGRPRMVYNSGKFERALAGDGYMLTQNGSLANVAESSWEVPGARFAKSTEGKWVWNYDPAASPIVAVGPNNGIDIDKFGPRLAISGPKLITLPGTYTDQWVLNLVDYSGPGTMTFGFDDRPSSSAVNSTEMFTSRKCDLGEFRTTLLAGTFTPTDTSVAPMSISMEVEIRIPIVIVSGITWNINILPQDTMWAHCKFTITGYGVTRTVTRTHDWYVASGGRNMIDLDLNNIGAMDVKAEVFKCNNPAEPDLSLRTYTSLAVDTSTWSIARP